MDLSHWIGEREIGIKIDVCLFWLYNIMNYIINGKLSDTKGA